MHHSPSTSTWHILGTGALGGLWAMRLHTQTQIRLLMREATASTQTLTLHDGDSSLSHEFVTETAQSPGFIEHLLVATKSYDTRAALEALSPRLNAESQIYLMQNGLGSQNAVLNAFPESAILAITTTEGAYRSQRFEITHAGRGTTWVGPLNAHATVAQAEAAAELFNAAGFATDATSDIAGKLWLKLAINCAINPFTALLDCPNGMLPEHDFFRERIAPLCEEISRALHAAGCAIPPDELQNRVDAVIQGTAHNLSSMLQDARAGRRTEIDAINGYLSEFCAERDLPCPINQQLVRLVKAQEPV